MAQPGRKKREDSPYAEQSQRLSAWLRSLRESAGLSQDQLARRAGVTVATLRKLEAGKIANPGYFIVMALLGALDARPEDLSAYADPATAADQRLLCATPQAAGLRRPGLSILSLQDTRSGVSPNRSVIDYSAMDPSLSCGRLVTHVEGGATAMRHLFTRWHYRLPGLR